jgi:hypothetical protein
LFHPLFPIYASRQLADKSDILLPLEPVPSANTINEWIALHTLPLVVDFSQVCGVGLMLVYLCSASFRRQDPETANFGLTVVKLQLLAFIDPKKVSCFRLFVNTPHSFSFCFHLNFCLSLFIGHFISSRRCSTPTSRVFSKLPPPPDAAA